MKYVTELFEDHRKGDNVKKRNFVGSPIMKGVIRAAIRKLNSGKATGPDGISEELPEAQLKTMELIRSQHY